MIKITILTLFPEFIKSVEKYGVLGRAIENNIVELEILNIRDFSLDKHKKVDDEQFGGGAGMLMTPQPVFDAIEHSKSENSKVIYLSPQGSVLNQDKCKELSKNSHLILLCGHYEGVDSRIINNFVDEEISVGDYVVTGGEIPALLLMDAVCRMVDGVLGNSESATTDSHYDSLLQYDVFTRPRNFKNIEVPEVLLSGNHEKIKKWREESSLINTKNKRPDLYDKLLKK
ncbi:MAG: tRNA (guanosine(37)-N1)-methyltransferase TrmD [Peptoniphilaceae bacterium]|uniref:tRNA (guanosine(37)-N1)-methyltransferase TrmD n=1 Tax=Parvimonas sp. TaxID=1944660 RepID=UPI002600910F|nr:tRNA (guanosine(37)-N1)-methyltransferase TrmD [Parvimonas sp.]MCI5997767.1 tRNA (guanosine(37)-N1)-methyltransferase TrmD [Parvimonas sp.]MDD7765308.1 tRNA (guanosine(37)-N1)-methyltransferase TrmD [Peptoniphilaceae bacterium]MDY3050920.1 tRNA (guanosine(37)-N1)-methyltransferase TrmD [Parvimonas sp.]